jgi:hypothetical protein
MKLNIVFYKENWIQNYKKISSKNDLVYFIGPCIFDDKKKVINNHNELNDIALKERDNFCDWIASFNDLFIEKKLIYKDLSLFFLSDLSVKRNEVLDTFDVICILKQIKNIYEKNQITKIDIYNCDPKFEIALKSFLQINNIKIINYYNKKKTRNIFLEFFSTLNFFSKCFIVSFFNYRLISKKKIKNVYLSTYPSHFKNNKYFSEDKYKYLFKIQDTFLLSLLTDGFHQNLNIIEYFKNKKELEKIDRFKIIILESFLKFTDIFLSLLRSFNIFFKILILRNKTYIFNKINLSDYIKIELNVSFSRISRNILIIKTLNNFFTYNSVLNFYYYMHEYPIGRSVSYALKKNNVKNSFAFQHGPASNRKILYFLSKNETNQNLPDLKRVPMPKNVYAEESFSQKIYNYSNYKNVIIMDTIPRLDYLKDIKPLKDNHFILIVPGLHDGKFLLDQLKKNISNSNSKTRFIFKSHPKSNLNISNYITSAKLTISKDHISKLLCRASKVICTYSSVAIEAKILGLEVELIDIPGKVNLSPLIDNEFLNALIELKKKLMY